MTGMKNCAFSLLLYPLKKKKLSILPHKQNVHREQKEVVAENAAQRSSWGDTDVRWKMIPRVDLLPPQHCWCIISFSHLNTVRGQGACGRSPVRCVHPGGGAMRIWVLVPSRPQLRAATVRVRLHLPAGDQVGLQAWRDRNKEKKKGGRHPVDQFLHSDETVIPVWMKVSVVVVVELCTQQGEFPQQLLAWS